MDTRFPQNSGQGTSMDNRFSYRNTFPALLGAIPTAMLGRLALGSWLLVGVVVLDGTPIMYLDTSMETRIRHRPWPCRSTNVRLPPGGDIVLGVLQASQIVSRLLG